MKWAVAVGGRRGAGGPGCRKPPEGSHALPGGFTSAGETDPFRLSPRAATGFRSLSLPPARSAWRPAQSSEPIGCDQRPRNRLTFGPNILWRACWSSRRPSLQSRRSGFATAPPTTCTQGTRDPKTRQLLRHGFGYLTSEPQPNMRACNELARKPSRNPHAFQQVVHNGTTPHRTAELTRTPRRRRAGGPPVSGRAGIGCRSQNQNSR